MTKKIEVSSLKIGDEITANITYRVVACTPATGMDESLCQYLVTTEVVSRQIDPSGMFLALGKDKVALLRRPNTWNKIVNYFKTVFYSR